jgi:hypothetical protein
MGNSFGSKIPTYVQNQVNARQTAQGSLSRTTNQLLYFNSTTAWAKLSSGAKINSQRLKDEGIVTTKSGVEFAKQYILFNGAQNYQSGFPSDYSLGNVGVYGYMPSFGIESVDVQHLNNGSLRKANIKIKVFGKNQFDIINVLYLRLGYTMLLEWGNGTYLNNSGGYSKMGSTLSDGDFFNEKNYVNILSKILSTRKKYDGNYDGMLGKVSNFDWNIDQDGSYSVNLELISFGDITESLKVNLSPSPEVLSFIKSAEKELAKKEEETTQTEETKPEETKPEPNKETKEGKPQQEKDAANTPNRISAYLFIQKLFFFQQENGGESINATAIQQQQQENKDLTDEEKKAQENNKSQVSKNYDINFIIGGLKKVGIGYLVKPSKKIQINTVVTEGGWFTDEEVSTITFKPQKTGQDEFDVIYFGYAEGVLAELNVKSDLGYYMRLGHLLQYIQNFVIPVIDNGNKKIPLVNIDYSIDGNDMYYFPKQMSLDPRVCVTNTVFTLFGKEWNLFDGINEWWYADNSANLMNVYISFNTINQSITNNLDENGNLNLYKFLSSICSSLNVALGGVNNLEPVLNESTNTLKIIDGSYPNTKDKNDFKFLIYGYNGTQSTTVKKFDLKTGITSDYAQLITIGSTKSGYTNGAENTMFSKWNKGIIDRFKTEIVSLDTGKNDDPSESYVANFFSTGRLALGYRYSSEDDQNPNLEDVSIDKNISIVTDFFKYMQSKIQQIYQNYASPSQGFMALSLGLTLEGISGIEIKNCINVDTRIFPSDYPDNLRFIIKGVNHKISNQTWETTLETVVINEGNIKPISFATQQNLVNQELNRAKSSTGVGDITDFTGIIPPAEFVKNPPQSQVAGGGAGGPAIIVGDSTCPFVEWGCTKAKMIPGGEEEVPGTNIRQGESVLHKGGQTVAWVRDAAKKYPKVDPSVKWIVISLGTNDQYKDLGVKQMFINLREKFPSAQYIVVQGGYGPLVGKGQPDPYGGYAALQKTTPEQVKKYYDLYRAEGAIVIEPPIGNILDVHGNFPIYKTIGAEIDRIIGG